MRVCRRGAPSGVFGRSGWLPSGAGIKSMLPVRLAVRFHCSSCIPFDTILVRPYKLSHSTKGEQLWPTKYSNGNARGYPLKRKSSDVCSEVFRCQKKTIARNAKAKGQSVPTLPLSFAMNAVEAERANPDQNSAVRKDLLIVPRISAISKRCR